MSYDRVLPKPAPYYDLSSACTSTPLEHRVMSNGSTVIQHAPHVEDGNSRPGNNVDVEIQPMVISQAPTPTGTPPMPMSPKMPPVTEVAAVLAAPAPRKRTISLLTSESPRHERETSSLSLTEPSSYCFCPPEAKIPRPRNAFILFRQHTQKEVAARHPRIANPEISKIIGETWQTLSDDTKQLWKDLAETEKKRHQQRYPDYRYQPRRYGRNGNKNSLGTGKSNPGVTICNRCRMKLPSIPSTSLPSGGAPTPDPPPFPPQSNAAGPRGLLAWHQKEDWKAPSPIQPDPGVDCRVTVPGRTMNENGPIPPEAKRKRYNGNGPYFPIRRDISPDARFTPPLLRRPEMFSQRGPYMIGPLARPHRAGNTPQPGHDPSLTLPPLQSLTPSQQNLQNLRTLRNPCNAEAMVMTIPFLNKIKILSLISPPISPSPSSLGAVIAIEGQDTDAVKYVMQYLHDMFSKSQTVRGFTGPEPQSRESPREPDEPGETTEKYLQYHRTISAWLNISGEIVDFVNGNTVKQESRSSSMTPKIESPHPTDYDNAAPAAPTSAQHPGTPFRIALVPRYQLTTTDAHACKMLIRDSYTHTDHWQWMASLWRGCIGPNITILIRDCEKEELEQSGGGNPVENRLHDAGTLIIRRLVGSPTYIEEKALRRVGFEVEEYMRR